MKNFIKAFFVLAIIFSYSTTFAFVSWNGGAKDCTSINIGNGTTGTGINGGANNCWYLTSVNANAGEYVKVHIYFHNTGNSDATNTKISLNQQTSGSATSHTFFGSIKSDQGSVSFGPVVANISTSQTLTFVSSTWRNNSGGQMSFLNGQNGSEILSSGLDVGTATPSWAGQGSVVVLFKVSSNVVNPPQAQFIVTTDPINTATITSNSATLDGSYANGSAIATWFEYGTSGLSQSTFSIGSGTPFSKTINNLTPATTYKYRACASTGFTSKCGQVMYFTTSGNNNPPPPTTCTIYYFNANPSYVNYGSSSSLSWFTNGCNTVSLSGVGTVATSNFGYTVNPLTTTTYTLVAQGSGNTDTKTTSVTVGQNNNQSNPCSISYFSVSPSSVLSGNPVTLTWASSNCTSLYISGIGNVNASGSMTLYPTSSTTYTLNASGNGSNDVRTQYVSVGANQQQNIAPSVSTYQPTSIGQNSATLSGYASGNGGNINAWIEFPCYSSVYGQVNNTTSTNLSSTVYSLSPNTSYSYCAVAQNTNSGQVVRGSVVTFTTSGSNYYQNTSSPSVTTYSATNISTTSATLNGYVDPNNNYTTRWFRYGTSSSYLTMNTNSVSQGTSAQSVSDYIYNLSPNTTYYFQAVAQNSYGVNYGSVMSFNTNSSLIPVYNNGSTTVVTTLATGVTQTSAQINGILQNSSNVSTNVYFEYGTTVDMGLTTIPKSIGTATSTPFFETLSNLAPNTIYYYRANAENANGKARGVIEIFSTKSYNQNTNNTVTINTGTTRLGFESPIMLKIENRYQNIGLGDTIDYIITYKNIGSQTLTKPLLQAILPKYVAYTNSSAGTYEDSTRTLSVPLSDLKAGDGGVVYLQGKVISMPEDSSQIVSTALLVYTTPKGAQENAIAYVLNNPRGILSTKGVSNNTNLSASAFFAGLGLPGTLIGWLFWILIILLIILIIRTFFKDKDNNNHHAAH